jgi:orotate phosphoribosyltransferase
MLKVRSVRTGDFELSSGRRSRFYVDARTTTMSAEGAAIIGRLGLMEIRAAGWEPLAVGGLTLGSDPVAYALSAASLADPPVINAFTVRKATKAHGTQRRIEGCFVADSPVVVVEDVITSGASALDAVAAVKAEGGTVLGVIALLDREEGGADAIRDAGLDLRVLVRLSELGL